MADEDHISLSKEEFEHIVNTRIQDEKLKILIDDFKEYKDYEKERMVKIDHNISEIYDLIRSFPEKVNSCREELESDIHNELERHYATEKDMNQLRTDLTLEIKEIKTKMTVSTTVIVMVAGALQFLASMAWFAYKFHGG